MKEDKSDKAQYFFKIFLIKKVLYFVNFILLPLKIKKREGNPLSKNYLVSSLLSFWIAEVNKSAFRRIRVPLPESNRVRLLRWKAS